MSSATLSSLEAVVLHPAEYPELAAKVWCRVLSANVVVHCDRCQRVTNAAHAGDVCFGFYCSVCCPACRTMPTDADLEVMARNVEFAGWGAEGGRPKKPKVKIQRIETMRYRVRSLTAAVSVAKVERVDAAGVPKAARAVKAAREPGLAVTPKPFRKEPIPERIRAVQAGRIVSCVIDLMARPQGAEVGEIKALIGANTPVQSFLGFDLRHRIGYGYSSEDGVTVRLLLPEGMSGPMAHKVLEGRAKKRPTTKDGPGSCDCATVLRSGGV